MRLAIFGGSGFIGYDFVRSVLDKPDMDITVYTSGPKNLSNIARHDIDIELATPGQFGSLELHEDTDFIINYAHPFGIRDELNPKEQIAAFTDFVKRQKAAIPDLKLIHLSSMSVYEPFAPDRQFKEDAVLSPPISDAYAIDKVSAENALTELPDSDVWQLHLRPTVVYGPFGKPWTDRVFSAFLDGDVPYVNLDGRIQPVYVGDITRFINQSLNEFTPGIYNFGGDETISWQQYLEYYQKIAGCGQLVQESGARTTEFDASTGIWTFYMQNIKELIKNTVKDPAFDRMAVPLAKRLPRKFVIWVRDLLVGTPRTVRAKQPSLSFFASAFFAEDRLVSMEKFKKDFNGFEFTTMDNNRQIVCDYFDYRFTEKDFSN